MSQTEFDLYLSLLGKFLRLRRDQSQQIVDEIRDHLTERAEELSDSGLSRADAVRQALDEFGDAAALASHFTQLIVQRKRRRIMRFSLAGVGVFSAILLIGAAFWPDSNRFGTHAPAALAQGLGPQIADAPPASESKVQSDAVNEKLEQRLGNDQVKFFDTPLSECLTYLSEKLEVDITVARDSGLATDEPITLQLNHSSVKARTVLELILEQSGSDADYIVRDGLIYITNASKAGSIQVYNCRDLLAGMPAAMGNLRGGGGGIGVVGGLPMGGGGAGGGLGGPMAGTPGVGGMGGGGGGFGVGGMEAGGGMYSAGQILADVISNTIEPDSWVNYGGLYSIEEFNGLLVVKNRPAVHQKIAELLQMLRKAHLEQQVAVPGGIPGQDGGGLGGGGRGIGPGGGLGAGGGGVGGGIGDPSGPGGAGQLILPGQGSGGTPGQSPLAPPPQNAPGGSAPGRPTKVAPSVDGPGGLPGAGSAGPGGAGIKPVDPAAGDPGGVGSPSTPKSTPKKATAPALER